MDKIVVMIADKQALFRVGVCNALSNQPEFEVLNTAPDEKLMQMRIRPSHGDLERVVQVGNAAVAAHQQAAPDRRADFPQPHPQLIEKYRGVFRGHVSTLTENGGPIKRTFDETLDTLKKLAFFLQIQYHFIVTYSKHHHF